MPPSHEFYHLSNFWTDQLIVADSRDQLDIPAVFRGELIPDTPLNFNVQLGTRFADLLGTGYAGIYLVSERFAAALSQSQFTGWRILQAAILQPDNKLNSSYGLLSVLGRCGVIDANKSRVVSLPSKSPTGQSLFRFGYHFDYASWDGTDIFLPQGTRLTFLTDRVRVALEQANLDNVVLTNINEVKQLVPKKSQERHT